MLRFGQIGALSGKIPCRFPASRESGMKTAANLAQTHRKDVSMKLTGGQALARQLVLEGITDVFGVPGVQLDWAVDGLSQVSTRIPHVATRTDYPASYLAE